MIYLKELTEDEVKYICTVIPYQEVIEYFSKYPKEFAKIRPGFRAKSLSSELVVKILYDFNNKGFISEFLEKHLNGWIKDVNKEISEAIKHGMDQDAAYIEVLSQSYFVNNVVLYFKIKRITKEEGYLKALSAAVAYQCENRKKRENERSLFEKENKELQKNISDLNSRLLEKGKKLKKIKDEEIELREEISHKTKENQDGLKKIRKLDEDNCKLQEKLNKLQEKLNKLQKEAQCNTEEYKSQIDALTNKLSDSLNKQSANDETLLQYKSKLSDANDEIAAWKNKVRSYETQIFKFKTEIATLMTEQDTSRKRVKELQENVKVINENESKESDTYQAVPECPSNMDDFEEYFLYNLESIGFDSMYEASRPFIDYVKRKFFTGIPILMRRGPGINIANCLANTLYGKPVAARLTYSGSANVQEIEEFILSNTEKVICLDGYIGNCNEMELLPVLEHHNDRIFFLTYMYDKTLKFIPYEILSYVNFINLDSFDSILRIKNLTEDPSTMRMIPYTPGNENQGDSRSLKILKEIAEECGFSEDVISVMADNVESEAAMDEILMFSLLPYVAKVLELNPYNCSKRLQKYAGDKGRCSKKEILIRWFG